MAQFLVQIFKKKQKCVFNFTTWLHTDFFALLLKTTDQEGERVTESQIVS